MTSKAASGMSWNSRLSRIAAAAGRRGKVGGDVTDNRARFCEFTCEFTVRYSRAYRQVSGPLA